MDVSLLRNCSGCGCTKIACVIESLAKADGDIISDVMKTVTAVLDLFTLNCYASEAQTPCIGQVIGCEDRLRNGLYCVGWGVKLCSTSTLYFLAF